MASHLKIKDNEARCYCSGMYCYGMFSHHCLPNPSWHFTLMEKELPALL